MDRLARGQGVALWRQIEGVLEQSILQGSFAPSGRLPAEPELARRFGVNRHTVRQAVRALASRGILRIEQGRGTFVDMQPLDYSIGARTRFSSNLASRERLPSRVTLGIDEVELMGPTARALGLPEGSTGLRHRTLARADGTPVTLGTIYLPKARFPEAAASLAANPSVTALFTAAGHADYRRAWTRIGTRLPSPDEAQQLEQSRERPVLITEALDTSASGAPLAYNYTVWAGERVTLTVES
ncbi:phosphonate metabolism transcriptional regulator PhnF [Geminicoccus roseus]|uniref:phosphonate metabolism transcriptional regulator PhnF n=1 Tax=Geminicoccus roseus TaxID=404900 RepID=UPI000422A644|nr:phosphonate metabolism transcriptional regulator PhnF [Geminicoccus roseus]